MVWLFLLFYGYDGHVVKWAWVAGTSSWHIAGGFKSTQSRQGFDGVSIVFKLHVKFTELMHKHVNLVTENMR